MCKKLTKSPFTAVKAVTEPITHMPPTDQVDVELSTQPIFASQNSGWTKDQVKKWMTENNLADIAKK